jgi:hypothetical protein
MPKWSKGPCPWTSKAAFDADSGGARQKELRAILSKTVSFQTAFILNRLKGALPKMLAATKASQKGEGQLRRPIHATPEGAFCLIDYVNFKGEGTAKTERYNGQGWGLLQVLESMTTASPSAFASASKAVLSRRVQNAPAARKEQRWLAGWHNRCDGYLRKL